MSDEVIKVLAFAGSTREGSFNKKLCRIAAKGAEEAGAEVTVIDLRDFPMPLYDGDLEVETGLPDNALKLKAIFLDHHGLLISSPEYNSGYSAVLKNTIDWISRKASDNETSLSAFNGKVASLMAASPGALGGLRGLYQLRELLMNMNVTVLPGMRAVDRATGMLTDDGTIKDVQLENKIRNLGLQTVEALRNRT